MARYVLENLSEDNFEKLISSICKRLFGEGVHSFSKGRDASRDGYFEGEANCYPSLANRWKGKMIFQAKHTTKSEASCSDNDFFYNKTSVVKKEICKLKETLKSRNEQIDCYLIFTNRKMSGGVHRQIKDYLKSELGIENADIIGLEDINGYIDKYKDLVREYNLSEYMIPTRFYEEDIRQVINMFCVKIKFDEIEPIPDNSIKYVDKDKKNKLNEIDEGYFSDIRDYSFPYFKDITNFLQNPINFQIKKKYRATASDLRGFIQKNIEEHSFKFLLETIIAMVIGNDKDTMIFQNRELVRIFIHYMYVMCDIGRKS